MTWDSATTAYRRDWRAETEPADTDETAADIDRMVNEGGAVS